MTLQQTGNKVSGTYKYKGGRINGILNGNRLVGTWTQTNGKGMLEFVFPYDFSSFTGKWSYNTDPPKGKWNGARIGSVSSGTPAPVKSTPVPKSTDSNISGNGLIEGVYDTDFSQMSLHLNGNRVTGTYNYKGGKIDAVLQGNKLVGTWTQTNAKGRFEFVFSNGFLSFKGKWSYNNDPPKSKWDGRKIGTSSTARPTGITTVETSARPVDVAGSWYGSKNQRGRLNFWQNGNQFSVIMCWPDESNHWKTYKGDGEFDGRLMKIKIYKSNTDGRLVESDYIYYLTISDKNDELTGYYTHMGKKMDRSNFHYYRVK